MPLFFEVVGAEAVVDLNLPFGALEPLRGFAVEDDGELPLGVGLELLPPEEFDTAEAHLADTALVRLPVRGSPMSAPPQ